jgi:hypothetical protein
LLRGLVFIERLKGGVVGYGAIGKCEVPSAGDAFGGLLTAYDFGGAEELLDLLFAKGLLVRSSQELTTERNERSQNKHAPTQVNRVHRRVLNSWADFIAF